MAQDRNFLGIYLRKDAATVVCLGFSGRETIVLDGFSVSVEQDGQSGHLGTAGAAGELAQLIAQGCAERKLQFGEVAVALDCSMFMQHNLRSEFVDRKQIAATVRFDTEETLATDVSDVAIAFGISSTDRNGSSLNVFTASKKVLSEIILSLQSNNIDPVSIEPDVHCLSRFICRNVSLPERSRPFFCVFSRCNAYFVVPRSWTDSALENRSALRTLLIDPSQSRSDLLARELPVTTALFETDQPIDCLEIFAPAGSVDCGPLAESLKVEVDCFDLAASVKAPPQQLADYADTVDFAIAYGAAQAHLEKTQTVNLRSDFMPYQGKKVRLRKALKFAGISVTVLLLAVGMYFQLQLLQRNKYRARLRAKFNSQYSSVMFGKKASSISEASRKLAGELRRVRNVKSGQLSITGEESVSAKLTLVLEAFNKCAAQTDLDIDSVSVTAKTIGISASTSSRKNTLRLFNEIKAKLEILQQRLDSKGGRDNFQITVAPKNG